MSPISLYSARSSRVCRASLFAYDIDSMGMTNSERKISLVRIAHVYYTHADIAKAHEFLADFGFQITKVIGKSTYYRGYGSEPFVYCAREGAENEFGGAAFVVESLDDLEYASETLPNASAVYELTEAPGGGKCVTFHDPVDGFPFHLVYGQDAADVTALPELVFNFVCTAHGNDFRSSLTAAQPTNKHRAVNQFQRFQKAPSPIHKLGHFGMCVTDFAATYKFYTTRFNFVPSDTSYDSSGQDVITFLHLDRGKELVDHHCYFFFEGPVSHVHHSSFETHDFDTQVLGHDWLRHKGYENCWGVGRHILGSQIFDYWFDPSNFILEHYVDGDLVDNRSKPNRSPASPDGLHVWGPDLPPTFLV
ncbi:Glyoxalase/Bleomycin resistance protein/Dihydroxybiphenyl dioxygenase [Limtongia smithiae]|uniref:Glyoxalase/Bleomycin resistance protein/Dihydroxybiphenyl dioxygenase n=1 Tax=Limtongia smithiae TaxID=1125753 RepID=UPI0034CDE96A